MSVSSASTSLPRSLGSLSASHKLTRRKLKESQKSVGPNKQSTLIKVMLDGVDVTPEPLNPLLVEGAVRDNQASMFDIPSERSGSDVKFFRSQSVSRFYTDLHRQTLHVDSTFRQTFMSSNYTDDIVIEPERQPSSADITEDTSDADDLVSYVEVRPKMPTHISLILTETPTFYVLDLPSKTVLRDDNNAAAIEAENARYEYLTVGKGRNRKMVCAEVQTTQILQKTRTTLAERIKHRHNHAFASIWEMFDTFEKAFEVPLVEDQEFFDDDVGKADESKPVETMSEELQIAKLVQNDKFLEAVCVIERLLANNNFNAQQKRFRGLSDPDPFRENIEYKYRLDLLWTFANKDTAGRCVSAICWNGANNDILAVAYGKFFYTDRTTGMVMLWNIKNPVQPERTYRFEHPVTSINFSKLNPNVLGIGFYDGTIKLVDVSSRELRVISQSPKDSPSFEPVWQIEFFRGNKYFKGTEPIVTTCQDGRISCYRTQDSTDLIYSQLMRMTRPEGKLKGIPTLRRCHVSGIPITRFVAALVIQKHPSDRNFYYVGTNVGTIHKCSINYNHQHLDMFLAHDGPIYVMKFSPFCNKLFLTCGDDWNVRIWADGISAFIFELSNSMQSVQGADWSPTHATIIANVTGNEIAIWDLQRKTHKPQSVIISPTNSRNTVVQFTESGRCLVVGDIDGNVNIFALEDIPFPAFFQDDLLINAIDRGLITKPDLIKQLKKLKNLNFEHDENDE